MKSNIPKDILDAVTDQENEFVYTGENKITLLECQTDKLKKMKSYIKTFSNIEKEKGQYFPKNKRDFFILSHNDDLNPDKQTYFDLKHNKCQMFPLVEIDAKEKSNLIKYRKEGLIYYLKKEAEILKLFKQIMGRDFYSYEIASSAPYFIGYRYYYQYIDIDNLNLLPKTPKLAYEIWILEIEFDLGNLKERAEKILKVHSGINKTKDNIFMSDMDKAMKKFTGSININPRKQKPIITRKQVKKWYTINEINSMAMHKMNKK